MAKTVKKSPRTVTDIPQAAAFKKWCDKRNLSLEEVAAILGVSDRTVYRMFAGDVKVRRASWLAINAT